MRKFSSYGPINTKLHYYAPRQTLIQSALQQLLGDDPAEEGHYITVWAPRQSGKTWVMQQVVSQIQAQGDFEVAIITMQSAKSAKTTEAVLHVLITNLNNWFHIDLPYVSDWSELRTLFTSHYFQKPLILMIDEFDAIETQFINQFANEFRSIYTQRIAETLRKSGEKTFLLHGLALIGVRSVLGIENVTAPRGHPPFNVQRSLHIPNLTHAEVEQMFQWYAEESGQQVEQAVIDQVYTETNGQPGLVSWLGELLTETYNEQRPAITAEDFAATYALALHALPNNNILNIISKAQEEPYKQFVLEMFKTDQKIPFRYDDPDINFLYMNGVVDHERVQRTNLFVKFSSPFVQKRLFNYFSFELFRHTGQLHDPFADLSDTITPDRLTLRRLLQRYESYLQANRHWLLRDAPRRSSDLRIFEAIYHFNLFMYLVNFLASYDGRVYPEFPTGNGQIDLVIRYAGQMYGLEVKSFTNQREYQKALQQAAHYAQQLGMSEIDLVLFVEAVDEENRRRYETPYHDATTGVTVIPTFVATGQ